MLLCLSAIVALPVFLAVCFGLGELLFGLPQFSCKPAAGSPANAAADPTFCGYAYRAIGVGLALGLAIAIGVGLLTGNVWNGVAVALLAGTSGVIGRIGRWAHSRRAATVAGPGPVSSPTSAAAPRPFYADLFGAERPATRRDHAWLCALVAITFLFFLGAEFRSDRLFDPDGNDHAVCVRWLIDRGTLVEPTPERPTLHYIDAYPPGFDIAAAALGRLTGDRVAFPLRLLTALLIALSVAWLHGLVLELTRRPRMALAAAFFFMMAPNNLTSFIWSHALVVSWLPLLTLMSVRLVRLSSESAPLPTLAREIAAVALLLGGVCLVSPVPGVKAILWTGIVLIATAIQRNWRGVRHLFIAGLLAGCVALIWWGPMFAKYKNYHALWRAQLAPTIVERADTEHWTAPAATQVVGTGDVGINVGVNFWGWDRAGMGSETSAAALSLGWAQSLFTLLGLSAALAGAFRRHSAETPPAPSPPDLRAVDLLMGLLLAFTVFGLTGPYHGIDFYAYRFALLLPVTTAYFQARAVAVLLGAPRRFRFAAAGLIALAGFASLFGYGLFFEWNYWLGYTALILLLSAPLLGWAAAWATVHEPAAATGDTNSPAFDFTRLAFLALAVLFSLFAGGANRFTLNYLPPVPNSYLEMVGKTSE
ncbi:MAG TPA: hypothetical protein VL860_04960, partial [Planctomycetota bacterium]|nr:hypothetical protein [Planctomycetota bacterium]